MRQFTRKIGLFSLVFSIIAILGGAAFGQAYNFDYLSIQKGLPQSQAFCIMFDSDQYAWIGTQGGGLCRYDGENYTYYTKNDSLISNRIYKTKELDGSIWVGQKGGVTQLNLNGEFQTNYRLNSNSVIIRDIIFYKGEYLFASNNGVYQLSNNELEIVTDNPTILGTNIHNFFLTNQDDLWLCTDVGLLSFDDVFGKLSKAKGLSAPHVECAVEFKDEWVIGTYEGGLNFYNKSSIYRKEQFEELDDKIILSLFVSGENELWIGTMNNGVYVYNAKDGVLRNFRTSNGLSGNHIKTIVADYWDNIWIGTSGGGVSVFQNSPFIKYNSASGLNGDYVFSVLNDSRENLWLGTEGMGVMRINDTSKVLFDEESGFYSEKVKSIYEDSKGYVWFGTEGKGVGVYNPYDAKDTIYSFYNSSGLKGNWVKCFTEDPVTSKVYIGTSDGGIYYVKRGSGANPVNSFKRIETEYGEVPNHITALHYINGRLWFANDNGKYGFIQNGQITLFNEANKSFRNIVVHNNTVWIGSKDNGIMRLEMIQDSIQNKEWMNSGTNSGFQSNNIYQLIYHNSQLWIGTEKGLDRLDLDSNMRLASFEHFGYEEGFEGVETNINAGNVDQDGNLWFGTVDGLYVYKGRDPNQSQRKPPVLKLNDFQIVFESIENTNYANAFQDGKITSELILPYDQNHISFQFNAIHYSYAKNIRYRWKLDGIDSDWTPSTTINVATYPNLLPGEYLFNVQTAIDENWEQEPIQIAFSIDQPYWEKFWFKFAYYSLGIILLIVIVLLILARQRRKSKALNEKLKLEKNLLELEQKALRLQMNPHFIFNVLNSIHNLIILNDSDKARYALSKFSKLMRQVLENSREKFISIDDEVETLQNYVQLERLTANANIDLDFEFAEDMDTAEEILPPLMIQPFVENAIVHGLKGVDRKGEIRVSFKWIGDNVLECAIADNGIGRKKANEIKAQQAAYHKSTALQVAQERLANLNQETTFVPFEILDLKDPKGQPAGTKVIIRILV
ncbi:MAG: hypothetical protein GQ574_20285 [Crocinitomix sp.]|nr:hypothetical protein [Crocinitomix sp.]